MATTTKYPIRWLTYQQRVREDLREALDATEGDEKPFFTEAYMTTLAAPIKQQDDWLLKLLFLQGTILGFLAVGLVSPETKLGAFGFDLKYFEGLREILLAISATIALIVFFLASSRDTAVFMLKIICEYKHQRSTLPFAQYALPSAFSLRIYVPREYDRWIFAMFPQKLFQASAGLLLLVMAGIAFTASLTIHWALIMEIRHNPGLGSWSTAALVYVIVSYVLDVALLANRWLPFPYRDQSELKQWDTAQSTQSVKS